MPRAVHRDHRGLPSSPLRLLARWSPGQRDPDGLWLTTLDRERVADLGMLVDLQAQSRAALQRLRSDFGMYDFEGRSYRGWHHHMTLVSAAHAVDALSWLDRSQVRRA
jgi:hypothetical protein